MISLTQVLNGYITPVLDPLGFKKTGNIYRLIQANGDQALIDFQRSAGRPPEVVFFINIAVAPTTMVDLLDYAYEREHSAQPGPEDGLYRERLRPPQDMKANPVLQTEERWHFNDRESANKVGAHIAEMLGKEVAPKLIRLLDRERFLSYATESKENMPWPSQGTPRSTVLLLIDKGPSPALKAALQQAAEAGDNTVIDWAQRYLNRHNPRPLESPAN